ncbi:M20/M25/M40 family metallo-hydrolase [Dactylosporangium sp. CA-052675]|uniref:M20/M25/M40 family metallo-hydrolase n=1 Tax=Dactylosporangium sp. CA-052675 TaxID=3239927 RepID=UPI003D8EEBB1
MPHPLPAPQVRLPDLLADLEALVRAESPTADRAAAARCADLVAALIHEELGLGALHGIAVGGASDGNLTAGAGTPTLDGLGAVGGGAHADDEHVSVEHLARRAALLAVLVRDLLAPGSKD